MCLSLGYVSVLLLLFIDTYNIVIPIYCSLVLLNELIRIRTRGCLSLSVWVCFSGKVKDKVGFSDNE